jgi:hypothetical protein
LRLLKEVLVVEMDSWLQYTKWNEVLSQSKHNLVKTFYYTRMPGPDETQLDRLLRAWNRILERCLNTLGATDYKDALKWWASLKNVKKVIKKRVYYIICYIYYFKKNFNNK